MSGYLGMSDDEIMKMAGPTPVPPTPDPKPEDTKTETAVVVDPPVADEPAKVDDTPADDKTLEQPQNTEAPKVEGEKTADETVVKTDPTEAAKAEATKVDEPANTAVNYESEYKQIMAPFKANGEMIQPKSVREAIQLMQMGANYTHKMQQLAPKTKLLRMLEANGLDENKLSFLIDIDKKNPEAIKKLVKDAGIDPMDIDTSKEPDYREGNHKVTDAETKFYGVLDELRSNPEGMKTLGEINDSWDQASKVKLWENPEVMTLIHTQRENGIYDRINTEIKRLKTMGGIPADTEFLVAYQQVGSELFKAGAFDDLAKPAVTEQKPTPIATRPAVKPPAVTPNPKVEAASATRSSPQTASPLVNYLSMSDAEFEKQTPPPSR
jgi:hypothetical protein